MTREIYGVPVITSNELPGETVVIMNPKVAAAMRTLAGETTGGMGGYPLYPKTTAAGGMGTPAQAPSTSPAFQVLVQGIPVDTVRATPLAAQDPKAAGPRPDDVLLSDYIFLILDRSGSMGNRMAEVIVSVNRYIADRKAENRGGYMTIVNFDDQYEVMLDSASIASVPDHFLTGVRDDRGGYIYARGLTALCDAVGKTLTKGKEVVPQNARALVLIVTDGYENASKEWDKAGVKALVDELQGRGNWTVTFMGQDNIDAWGEAASIGAAAGSTQSVSSAPGGYATAFAAASRATTDLRSSEDRNRTKDFFGGEDQRGGAKAIPEDPITVALRGIDKASKTVDAARRRIRGA